ncbi:autotransporter outer membrane beta-barrel domain-containing protein, partial [Akkermansia sp.]|uniref:autotransporter outer membrane beta-barrel domain-containing protein n=1 Tax=Akkermansia sp. TaxID=1872421 RepID=UPI003992469D
KSFKETGYDPRHFDRGDMYNLSLPVGVGISKSVQFSNGVLWVNSLAVSYVPDVVRDNPETRARRLMNDFSWTARGSRPDRNAVRVNYNSTVVINPRWTAYGGYEPKAKQVNLPPGQRRGSYAF